MLVIAHDGGIDLGVFVIRVSGQCLKDPLPEAGLAPAAMTQVDDLKVAKPLW